MGNIFDVVIQHMERQKENTLSTLGPYVMITKQELENKLDRMIAVVKHFNAHPESLSMEQFMHTVNNNLDDLISAQQVNINIKQLSNEPVDLQEVIYDTCLKFTKQYTNELYDQIINAYKKTQSNETSE